MSDREYFKKWRAANKERVKAYSLRWRQRNAAKVIRRGRIANWKKYGIDPVVAETALARHNNGHCEICGTRQPGGTGGWHVDHDHRTKQIRGILCASCNRALGYFKDDVDVLEAAVRYLRTPRA